MNDDDTSQSADDALENSRQAGLVDGASPPLPEDNQTPAAAAADTAAELPSDHPLTDTDVDAHERYDEGLSGATGVDDQDGTNEKNQQATS